MPLILAREPRAKAGGRRVRPSAGACVRRFRGSLQMLGYVEDVREPLSRYAVFVCPILSGSGVRVKLLEAFAAGIPVVSTKVGAEGLAGKDGEFCAAGGRSGGLCGSRARPVRGSRRAAAEMALRARAEVEANWDMAAITRKLVEGYREMVKEKRMSATSSGFRSFLMRLTMSEAVRSRSLRRPLLAG